MVRKPRWFPFDAVSWMLSRSVGAMPWDAVGMYSYLLSVQWEHGAIPADVGAVHAVLRRAKDRHQLRRGYFSALWQRYLEPHFPGLPDGGRRANPRLAELRDRALAGERVKDGLDPDSALTGDQLDQISRTTHTELAHDSLTTHTENSVSCERVGIKSDRKSSKFQEPSAQRGGEGTEKREENMSTVAVDDSGGGPAGERPLTPVTPLHRFDFDAVYARYPRKEGKAAGMKTARARFKTQGDYDRLSAAVDNYVAKLQREGTEKQHTLIWSTFVNGRWEDYVDGAEAVTGGSVGVVRAPPVDEDEDHPAIRDLDRRMRLLQGDHDGAA